MTRIEVIMTSMWMMTIYTKRELYFYASANFKFEKRPSSYLAIRYDRPHLSTFIFPDAGYEKIGRPSPIPSR
ncbi:hypothetical protein BTA30_01615 [Bacillus swezeyi]|uniref:Uncharacterized protein n=1 Tax=Bacillus swezeyi TaxID=1925020 RepID=A0A1R1S2V0_9BACI|nr:hypothetical protein BW143_08250 [Bacillus swezeyi]OMI32610.1 hypothetical protein BTA30_01615 [Bacillus swezeyi]